MYFIKLIFGCYSTDVLKMYLFVYITLSMEHYNKIFKFNSNNKFKK